MDSKNINLRSCHDVIFLELAESLFESLCQVWWTTNPHLLKTFSADCNFFNEVNVPSALRVFLTESDDKLKVCVAELFAVGLHVLKEVKGDR